MNLKNIINVGLKNIQTNEMIKTISQKNMVVNTGKSLALDIIGGDTNYITYGAIGTGSGATSAGTIILVNEITRNPVIYNISGQVGTFSTFFNSTISGTISEIGFFGGTSAFTSTNTGTLFNRILVSSTIIKTSGYTLTVDLDITIS